MYWNRMLEQLEEPKSLKTSERRQYFYCQAVQIDEKEKKEKNKEAQEIYELTRNMSNIFADNPNLI
jgi:hypothetical protein